MTEARPLRARYIGYTRGTENHGDEALIWILRDLLAPDLEVLLEDSPADVALLGGGTLINQSPWLIDFFAEALDQCGRGIVFGTGVGDTAFWGNHFQRWNPLLNRCSHVGIRGPYSAQLLTDNGFNSAEVIGDPYLALNPPMENRLVQRRLAINVGSTNDALYGGDESGFLNAVSDLAAMLREWGWTLVWISVWSKDEEILRHLRSAAGAEDEPLYDARSMSLETLSAIARCDLFLGEKLHALAMSAVAGTPFIAWEYQPKVRDFAASIGMEEWVIPTSQRSSEEVFARLEMLRLHRAEVSSELVRQTASRRGMIHKFAHRVREWAREIQK